MKSPSQKGAKGSSAGRGVSYGLTLVRHWRLFALIMILCMTCGVTFYVYAKSVYYSKSLIRFRIFDLPLNSESATKETPYFRLQRNLMEQLRSRHLVERTAKSLGLVATTGTYDTIRDSFVKNVTISVLDTNTLKFEVYPYYAELAEIWTDAMIEEYNAYQTELRIQYRERAIETYMRELTAVSKQLEKSLKEKLEFENGSGFTETIIEHATLEGVVRDLMIIKHRIAAASRAADDLKVPTLSRLERLSRIEQYQKEAELEIAPNFQRTGRDRGPVRVTTAPTDNRVVVVPGASLQPALWRQLDSDMQRIEQEKAEKSKTYGSGHEVIKKLDQELALLDKRISSEADNAIEAFNYEMTLLKETKSKLEAKMPDYHDATARFVRSQENYKLLEQGELAWDKAHSELQKKIDELEFAGDKERIDLENLGIEQIREDPVSPNKMKLVYASLALGLALGIGLPLALEHFNDTASRIDEIERAFDLQGLGIVPVTDQGELENIVRSPEIDASIPNSLLENFRVIRSGIALNKEMPLGSQVMMITSSRPSEGKTTIAANLGWAFASINGKTLLIDSDLRRGRLHDVLDVPNTVGLTNVLNAQCTLEEAIQPTKVPNLSVITRGPIIPGSTEHLCTIEHELKIQRLRQMYDHIIMDCPPVLGLSETGSLMRLVDGVVFTIRAERTTHRDIHSAVTLLRKAGADFYGFVLNRLDLTRIANYHNYYYYSSYYYDEMLDNAAYNANSRA